MRWNCLGRARILTLFIFMDVELVDGNCFDILKQVRIDVPVIFTTAYGDFAIKAFQLNSMDYLLKPLTQDAV